MKFTYSKKYNNSSHRDVIVITLPVKKKKFFQNYGPILPSSLAIKSTTTITTQSFLSNYYITVCEKKKTILLKNSKQTNLCYAVQEEFSQGFATIFFSKYWRYFFPSE